MENNGTGQLTVLLYIFIRKKIKQKKPSSWTEKRRGTLRTDPGYFFHL